MVLRLLGIVHSTPTSSFLLSGFLVTRLPPRTDRSRSFGILSLSFESPLRHKNDILNEIQYLTDGWHKMASVVLMCLSYLYISALF